MDLQFSRLDRIVWRINGFLLLLACLGGLGLVLAGGIWTLRDNRRGPARHDFVEINEATKKEELLRLGYFHPLSGTDYFLVSLSPVNEGSGIGSKLSSYSQRWEDNSRNYMLFNAKTKESHWVWPNNLAHILGVTELDNRPKESRDQRVSGLLFELVDKDTNSDGVVDAKDQRSLQYLAVGAPGLSSVVPAADRIIGLHQISPAETIIFYSLSGQSYFSAFNATTRTALEGKPIAKVH